MCYVKSLTLSWSCAAARSSCCGACGARTWGLPINLGWFSRLKDVLAPVRTRAMKTQRKDERVKKLVLPSVNFFVACLCRPTLSSQERLSNCGRSPTPGGVPAVSRSTVAWQHVIEKCIRDAYHVCFCFQRVTSCSENQSESHIVQTL